MSNSLKISFFAAICGLLLPLASPAHEGEHSAPSSAAAQKGGVVRSTENVHLELVRSGKAIQIYAFDLDLKPLDPKNLPTILTVTLPKKKVQSINPNLQADHWAFDFDAKGAHRFTITMKVTHEKETHKVSWTIEPGKEAK
jgi:hypothetical protein